MSTQQKIAPLQDQINSLDVQIKGKVSYLASQKGQRATYASGTYKIFKDKYELAKFFGTKSGGNWCATGYPFSAQTCGDVAFWTAKHGVWSAKFNQAKAALVQYDGAIVATEADIDALNASKNNLEMQIASIIAADKKTQDIEDKAKLAAATAAALTDPVILGQMQDAEVAKQKAAKEAQAQMMKYALIALVIALLGFAAIRAIK